MSTLRAQLRCLWDKCLGRSCKSTISLSCRSGFPPVTEGISPLESEASSVCRHLEPAACARRHRTVWTTLKIILLEKQFKVCSHSFLRVSFLLTASISDRSLKAVRSFRLFVADHFTVLFDCAQTYTKNYHILAHPHHQRQVHPKQSSTPMLSS